MAAVATNRASGCRVRAARRSSFSLTVREAASQFRLSEALLYGRVESGDLPAFRLGDGGRGSRIRLDARDVQQLAERRARKVEYDRRAIEAALAWPGHASPRGPRRNGCPSGRTRERLAEIYDVAPTAVQRARGIVVRDRALAEAVSRAELSLAEAARTIRERERAA